MITKYKIFENNTIRYISNGFDDCSVCGSDDIKTHVEYEYQECVCEECDFPWIKNTEDVYSESLSDNGNVISDDKKTCHCNSSNIDMEESEMDDFELIEYMRCYDCHKQWSKVYDNTVVSAFTDEIEQKEIIKGDIIDIKLIDLTKYKKTKIKKFNL